MASDDYCPICGKRPAFNHRCEERTLRAIDAAHKRDLDSEQERRKPYGERLHDGTAYRE